MYNSISLNSKCMIANQMLFNFCYLVNTECQVSWLLKWIRFKILIYRRKHYSIKKLQNSNLFLNSHEHKIHNITTDFLVSIVIFFDYVYFLLITYQVQSFESTYWPFHSFCIFIWVYIFCVVFEHHWWIFQRPQDDEVKSIKKHLDKNPDVPLDKPDQWVIF